MKLWHSMQSASQSANCNGRLTGQQASKFQDHTERAFKELLHTGAEERSALLLSTLHRVAAHLEHASCEQHDRRPPSLPVQGLRILACRIEC